MDEASELGARFISSTFLDVGIVERTKELGLISIPGVSTESEALAAVRAGGDILKVFPATQVSPTAVGKIAHAVSLFSARFVPVIVAGGIGVEHLKPYANAGASGFAVGKTLLEAEMSTRDVNTKGRIFIGEGRVQRWAQSDRDRAPS